MPQPYFGKQDMCGIAGIIRDRTAGAADTAASLRRLAELSPPPSDAESHIEAGREADRLSASLIHPAAFEEMLRPETADLLRSACARASELKDRCESMASKAGGTVLEAEAWNSAAVVLRDACWRLERDVRDNLPKMEALVAACTGFEGLSYSLMLRHAFDLNLMLNSIDRIEVRGRDSAGLGTMVWLEGGADEFLEAASSAGLTDELGQRERLNDFVDGSVIVVRGSPDALVFAHKTAHEIGALGQNVSVLRAALASDRLYWAAVGWPGAIAASFSHTRWASNGIVNEANCHPVSDVAEFGSGDGPRFLAVLNGDIDNYQRLRDLQQEAKRPVPPFVTTDAKIIPMRVAEHYRECGDVDASFRAALSEFEGSFAIALLCTASPQVAYLAIRGSGQALYVGRAPGASMYASETYGLVEACDGYLRMDGELAADPSRPETRGQVAALASGAAGPVPLRSFDGSASGGEPTVHPAAITTRDIHRGEFNHYFLKEITESPASLEKTIRGKFSILGDCSEERPVFAFGPETVPPAIMERFSSGQFRRVLFIGQGTASIAAQASARLWQDILGRTRMVFEATKASELSGFGLFRDMSDTLVVAVSQSGTTTDTNRTVEMVKKRGAAVLSIVNRRQSDLVHRSDGVVYTGDGRDVEMSVASTKAFYAQVAAGYLLGLYLCATSRSLPDEEICRRLKGLSRMPDLLREMLRRVDRVRDLAFSLAPYKRHWAVAGSGFDRIAGEEIRIKLSELNYKSISSDFLEDKKHIDLSSEPLVIACTVSQPASNVPDAVKEVAIFRAHRATPVVIAQDGEDRFAAYAAGVIHVPVGVPELAFVVETMAGHLFSYFAALAIDSGAALLKEARAAAVKALPAARNAATPSHQAAMRKLRGWMLPLGVEFSRRVRLGMFNSGFEVETASRLLTLFAYVAGLIPLHFFHRDFGETGTFEAVLDHFLIQLSRGIGELSRPIDAIKHQAKTVTVGISRREMDLGGPVFEAIAAARFPLGALDDLKLQALEAASRAVASVRGYTLYEIVGLDESGRPVDSTSIRVVERSGASAAIGSRANEPRPLFGTKRSAVARGRVVLGTGKADGRQILIVPASPEAGRAMLILLQVEYRSDLDLDDKLKILKGYYERYDEIRWAASEIDPGFSDSKLAGIPLMELLEKGTDALAERIVGSRQ